MSKAAAGFWVLLLLFPASIWSGYVTARIWTWFAEPIGAPHVTVVRAMGLAVLVGMFRYSDVTKKSDDEEDGGKLLAAFFVRALLVPAVALLFGYVYSQFL